jgi:nanoRNase/pAp phosphatase (c-di-AMP/oligoRNAs hydrolase)
LFIAVSRSDSILILLHNNPDPDAIASAVALLHILSVRSTVESNIVYQGIIGQAENKELVRSLGNSLKRLSRLYLDSSIPFALVDTQPGAGNNSLPAESTVAIVIDHHPCRRQHVWWILSMLEKLLESPQPF